MKELHHWTAEQLEELPAKREFRQRGMEMTRLETFTDAAFAFAVTLLVVGGGDSIPTNFEEMTFALQQVPAFAASFANIMMFWYAHHIWSRRFGVEDLRAVFLSLSLIFVVLIYVYPLKAIYSGAFEYFTNGYLESVFVITSYSDLRSLFAVFGTGYALMASVIVLLNRHALQLRSQLALNEVESFDTQTQVQFWVINLVVATVSVLLAIILPDKFVVIAGLFYSVFGIVMPWHGIKRDRSRRRLESRLAET